NFDLKTAAQTFDLTKNESMDLFSHVEPIAPGDILRAWLAEFAPIAAGVNTEMARREVIITPILAEAKRRSRVPITFFPGVALTADAARGRSGVGDCLIARSPEIYYVEAAIIAVVEAKREDLSAGLGQCVAEMVAIQLFNEREGMSEPVSYGCVTSGNLWKFL